MYNAQQLYVQAESYSPSLCKAVAQHAMRMCCTLHQVVSNLDDAAMQLHL